MSVLMRGPAPSGPAVLYLYQNLGGCSYWRVLAPAQALVLQGYPVRALPIQDARAFAVSQQCQALVLVRLSWQPDEYLSAVRWIASLHERGLTVIYETDDDIFSEAWFPQGRIMEPNKPDWLLDQDRQQRIRAMRLCDGVIVTTPRLATLTRCYTDAPVVVVPNAIPWDDWRAVCLQGQRAVPDGLLIGWAGGKREDGDLAPMAAAWGRIAARYPQTRFVVVGHQPSVLCEAVPPDRLTLAPWLPVDVYPTAYKGWDIGCCPLEDKPFNFYKSAIKSYELAAAGAAVVYSPPVYGREMRPNIDGLPATTADEWEAALMRLVEDGDLRRRVRRSWARRVQERHSLAVNSWRFPAAWQTIVSQRRKIAAVAG